MLDRAEGAAERAQLEVRTELLQARDVGAALVDEAVSLEADVMLLGLPYRTRRGGDFAMGQHHPLRVPERSLQGPRHPRAGRAAATVPDGPRKD